MSVTTPTPHRADEPETFVETALKLSGKSAEEAQSTGAIDRADEQVETLFATKYQTTGSPVHRAVWEDELPGDLFVAKDQPVPDATQLVMLKSLEIVRERCRAKTLLDAQGKVSPETLGALAEVGYWGLLVDQEYSGQGAPFQAFAKFLTQMATVDATVAGLASVHGCIGAVDPLRTFGNLDQKRRYLPLLATGKRLSAFALTEPAAGSDLTALRTRAVLDGGNYVVNGEKLFITNAIAGRTIGLVCLIDDKPAVLIADLPDAENEHFHTFKYGLYALKHTHNNGLVFRDFRVPRENLLEPGRGDGLTIAYHGLNRGRVALCANAAGTMRIMLASILPWARFRRTYGEAIETRELVRRRVGRLAALIVGCDALTEWCAWLLDEGYRGEMECIIAKIFGSEAQKEAAVELLMKTHGGRAFLHGHLFGDQVHEFLAPCIYEGEGEMLGMAFLKSLVKEHGKRFFEPIGRALQATGLRKFNPANPLHCWKLRKALVPYGKWWLGQRFRGGHIQLPRLPENLRAHAEFAANELQKSRLWIDKLMTRHQLNLTDRQCALAELSQRIQDLVVMLTTALYAGKQNDEIVRAAADVLCHDLKRRLTGARPTNQYFRTVTKLGEQIAEGRFKSIAGVEPGEILMPYTQ
jgi:alkylation response protein AidB-like acyl-CoA dehydrogenase